METRIIKVLALVTITFGLTFGVKAHTSSHSTSLQSQNQKALIQDGNSYYTSFEYECEPSPDNITCMFECPLCGRLWEILNRYGIGSSDGCPICCDTSD